MNALLLFSTRKSIIARVLPAYGLIGYFGATQVARLILKIPTNVLYPLIFLTAFVASYAARGSLFDVTVMTCAGFVGWLMRKFDFNIAAFVISFVLAKGAEETFRQSLLMSDGGPMIFVERPIAALFIVIGIAAIALRVRTIMLESKAAEGSLGDA